ncbi:MAG: HAD-IA family hydrolase [Acidobacteria bacterium]|nr:HAD-IA family hydrolase [Acidobacteriota bacterium]
MKLPMLRPCNLFLFDLDGTLIDSLADIACAVNLTLARIRVQPLQESDIADFVGNGLQPLIERSLRKALGRDPERAMVQEAIPFFKEEYGNHLLDQTRLFPNVREGLDRLPWARFAVVSNKPEGFSRRILDGLGIGNRFDIILGGDSIQKRKPDPESLFKAIDFCKGSPSRTAIVGDSPVDIRAGKSAGITTCGVVGGFRPKEELEAAGCDILIRSLLELADHFRPPE